MSSLIHRRVFVPRFPNVADEPDDDDETIERLGGIPLDPNRYRQTFEEAVRDCLEQNRGALIKLAYR
ncbi:MAG TPA: hypothetical protein VM555_09375 [Tahibacter sp.]|nr:hypothetical protein [Tahibacter sp.]